MKFSIFFPNHFKNENCSRPSIDSFRTFYLLPIFTGISKVGGVNDVFSVSDSHGRINTFNFDLNPANARITVWGLVLGTFFTVIGSYGTGQATIQRYSALPSKKQATICLLLNVPVTIFLYLIVAFLGLTVFTYYTQQGCDPLRDGTIGDRNQLIAIFIQDVVHIQGIPGLVMAVLFSGALSSMSSSLSSIAAMITKDFLEYKYPTMNETRKTFWTKTLTFLFGIFTLAVALAVQYIPAIITQVAGILHAATGPLVGIFLLGMIFPCANKWGAMIGSLLSAAFVYWISVGANIAFPYASYLPTVVDNCTANANDTILPIPHDKDDVMVLYKISFLWYAAIAIGIVLVTGLVVSYATGWTDPKTLEPCLTIPMQNLLLPCLPNCTSQREKPHARDSEEYEETVPLKGCRTLK